MQHYTLNSGRQVPVIGFGTWEIKDDEVAKQSVLAALQAGYRVIDTAHIYGNERGVGAAILESGIPREDLFVTTKLWNNSQGYESALKACQDSLEKLGLNYLDLYLIHWPATSKRHDSWRALVDLKKQGLVKDIGISNYTIDHLKELLDQSDEVPAINQVEFHPFIYEQQQALLEFCRDQRILIEAYSPISRLGSANSTPIHRVAERLGRSPQQVALRWCIQHGTLPLPRSTSVDHIKSNFNVFDFELSDDDMKALNDMSDGERVTWDPAGMG